jgi:prepilin-type N-terminal cleavage/methylation domain-containing protein
MERHSPGFSLVECLVATALLATAIVSLGQLIAMSAANAGAAHDSTFAALLAQRKVDEWRGLPASDLVESCGGEAVSSSCVDYLDANGELIAAGGSTPPAGTAYVLRWSTSRSGDLWLLEVRAAALRSISSAWSDTPPPTGVRFLAARTGMVE